MAPVVLVAALYIVHTIVHVLYVSVVLLKGDTGKFVKHLQSITRIFAAHRDQKGFIAGRHVRGGRG